MIDREGLTRHIRSAEDKIIISRMLDRAEAVLKNYIPRNTDFFDPYQISLCRPILNKLDELKYFIAGGVAQSERQIIVMFPDYMEPEEIESPLSVLQIDGDFENNNLSHRDILGAILGLGIKREKIGDIIVSANCAYIVSFKEICDFMNGNLAKISRYSIETNLVDLENIKIQEENYKLIETTVPSLRLDALVGVGFGESRSSLSKMIGNDRVKVNWKPINNPAHPVHEGDVISFKGKGRILLLEVGNKTKKDRYKVTIKRMI
ncbi:RNA-binding protein YlmH [Anaerosolibacter carboniphilus]|uniref:RNA-binding protein YlmH n=1 Tax=Anaerosolibacter carboniphilus TaxID=1417629 RepID=A0A841KTD9_9FIRM|nr:YlmH/Sll1252 family protein [Anaerosolibacter carboniphilus]MBB6216974.1 RNA-binding protein YlmH [Anaerosolibacter carboniphilus]